MIRKYHHIISLGGNCRPAHHIKKNFPSSKQFPFDSWLATLESTVRFLEEPNIKKLYRPDLLELKVKDGVNASVFNSYYNIYLHHEFPRDAGGVVSDFRNHIDIPRRRTRMRMNRMTSILPDAPVLFIKLQSTPDPKDAATWDAGLKRLETVFTDRYGLRNFDILLINTPITRNEGRIRSLEFPDVGEDWRGDIANWTAALSQQAELLQFD